MEEDWWSLGASMVVWDCGDDVGRWVADHGTGWGSSYEALVVGLGNRSWLAVPLILVGLRKGLECDLIDRSGPCFHLAAFFNVEGW
jgi:hypothetical protein